MAQAEAKIVLNATDNTSGPLGAFQARLAALTAPLDSVRNKLLGAFPTGAIERLQSSLGGVTGKLAAVGIGAGVGIGGLALVKTGIDAVIDTAQKADRISDLGGRLRLNAEEFQVFDKIAKAGGSSVEELGGAFLKFKLNIAQAQSEGGDKMAKLQSGLAAFGIKASDLDKMKPLELMKVMGKISAASGTDKDELMKIQLFRDLFGKLGASQINVIEEVGTKYDQVLAGMRASGLLMSDEMVKRGGDAFKAYEKSQGAMQGLKLAFGIEMSPVFEKFSNVMESRMKANRTAMMPGVKALADVLSTSLAPFLDDMDKLADKTSGAFKVINKLAGLVGWDRLIFGGLAIIAAPFVASAGAVAVALYGVAASVVKSSLTMLTRLVPSLFASTGAAYANGGAMGVLKLAMGGVTGAASKVAASIMGVVRPLVMSMVVAYANGGAMGVMSLALGTAGAAFMTATRAVLRFTLALLTNPVVLIAAGIAAAAYFIYQNWDGVSSFFKGVWQGIVASAEPLKPFFVAIGDIAEWVGEKIVDLVGWFAKLFGRVDDATGKTQDWSNAGMLVGEVIGGLLLPFKALGKILDVVKTAGGDLLEFFRNFKMPSLSLPDFVAPSFAALRTAAGGAFDWVSTAWDKTSATLQAVPEAAFSKISQLGIGTADALSGAWASAKAALSTFSLPSISIDSIKQALSPMAGLLQPLQPLVDSLKTSFGAVTQVLSALGVGLLTVASLAGRGAIVMAEWGASGKVMTDIVTAGLNLVLAPFRALIALIDTAVAGFRVIGSLLSNLPKMPDLPSFLVPSAAPVTYSAPNALPSIIGSTPGLSASGLSLPSSGFGLTPATSPFAQVATPSIISQRTDVGGKLDIRIMADGQVRTERLESNNRNFQIDARNGSMFAG